MAAEHLCHAYGCGRAIPPRFLMCQRHWGMVPRKIQHAVWRYYRPGQETDKKPSAEYLLAQRAAVWSVFVFEGGCLWPDVPEVGTLGYMIGPASLGRMLFSQRRENGAGKESAEEVL